MKHGNCLASTKTTDGMEDSDLIARVYPVWHENQYALDAIRTSPLYIGPVPRQVKDQAQHRRHTRQSTEPPEHVAPDDDRSCIELRFSKIPRSRYGIIFGRSPKCEVVIPFESSSSRHFSLMFDEENRLIVRDLGSLVGTEVTYDGEGHGERSNFRWIVGGDPTAAEKTDIIIKIYKTVSFQIVAAFQDIKSTDYIEKVHQFRQGTAATEDLIRGLHLPRQPDTRLPTGTHTPGKGELYLQKRLGRGSFGVVTHFWNVSNGSEYALKEPAAKVLRLKQRDTIAWRHVLRDWKREANTMDGLAHVCQSRTLPMSPILTSRSRTSHDSWGVTSRIIRGYTWNTSTEARWRTTTISPPPNVPPFFRNVFQR